MIGKGATPSFFAIANYNYTLTLDISIISFTYSKILFKTFHNRNIILLTLVSVYNFATKKLLHQNEYTPISYLVLQTTYQVFSL